MLFCQQCGGWACKGCNGCSRRGVFCRDCGKAIWECGGDCSSTTDGEVIAPERSLRRLARSGVHPANDCRAVTPVGR
jgi:hypothetical protein